jgi:hypothetical protein
MNNGPIITTGKVEYVEGGSGNLSFYGEADAWRIKVRLDSDKGVSTEQLPWAFPGLPKTLLSVPKVGEGVLVVFSEYNNPYSQRYYIGPLISQPQYQEYCSFGDGGRGPAMSLISTSKPLTEPALTSISRKKELTKGAFPDINDVALLGRGREDIVLKYRNTASGPSSEIDLRAGIRLNPTDSTVKYMKGNVVFNTEDPAYIQVKHSKNGLAGLKSGEGDNDEEKYESIGDRTANSVINIVADKVNIISHKDSNSFGELLADRDNLVKDGELDQIMSLLHRAVYGDELITLLKKIVMALVNHTHPYSMIPPTVKGTELEDIIDYNYEKIISPNVRIS